jgi:prepilin peptidase CpaA
MDKSLFTDLLCGALALMLLWAAVVDIRTRTIANGLNLAIALMAPLFWWAMGVDLWPDAAIRVGVAMAVFVLFALALWFAPGDTVLLIVLMSLAGGVLTLIVMIEHRIRKTEGRPEVPYGVAISFGGLWLLAQRFLNHFA